MLSGLRSEQSYALTTTDRGACGGDQVNPFIIAIHCSSHRIALCMKDTTENTPWVLVHQTYLTESYALLARSPKKNELYKVCAELLGVICISPKRLHIVRWYGFTRCVEQQWEMAGVWELFYEEVVAAGEQPAATTAGRLLELVRTLEHKVLTAYLYDVLQLMQKLSATVQTRDINFERYARHLSTHTRSANAPRPPMSTTFALELIHLQRTSACVAQRGDGGEGDR